MRNTSRRTFIKHTLAGTAGIAAMPLLQGFRFGANDTIRIGIIGLGQQAMNLMMGFARIEGIEIVAGADVYGIKRQRFEKRMKDFYQKKGADVDVKTYKDYKEIIDRQDIDAVVIATPDHWHTLMALDACDAGKDIYLEKPITFTLKESLVLAKKVRESKVILAVGSQQRSDPNFQHAVKMAQTEAIGKLRQVHAYVGRAPQPYNLPEEPIPADLDWDKWLGPNPYVHYNSRLFTTDWGAHNFDIGQWGLGKNDSGPVKIIPAGYIETDHLTFLYDNGVVMSNQPWDEGKTRGVKFWGDDGWIEVSRGRYAASDDSLLPEGYNDKNKGLKYESGTGHLDNFVNAVRERKDPIANIETGQRTVATCILGNIASELGRPVSWDPEKQYFVNDPEAEKYFHREYRIGYKL
jgi:predicted dehydrogenase